jgi:DNA-directed RNA polymerase subunit M/transcription elongation factor TFIIS
LDKLKIPSGHETFTYYLSTFIYQELENGKNEKTLLKELHELVEKAKEQTLNDFVFSLPNMKEFHEKIDYYLALIQKEIKTEEGLYRCRFCKSNNTSYTKKQMRRADESENKIVYCSDCGKRDIRD